MKESPLTNSILPPLSELNFSATRSRGPGGQNVNKVSSAAQMTWDYGASQGLTIEKRMLIEEKLANHINKAGLLYIHSDEFRDLERNKQRCIEKLEEMLKRAYHRPKPRKKTKPSRSSQIKRVDEKKQRGQIKKNRKKVDY